MKPIFKSLLNIWHDLVEYRLLTAKPIIWFYKSSTELCVLENHGIVLPLNHTLHMPASWEARHIRMFFWYFPIHSVAQSDAEWCAVYYSCMFISVKYFYWCTVDACSLQIYIVYVLLFSIYRQHVYWWQCCFIISSWLLSLGCCVKEL